MVIRRVQRPRLPKGLAAALAVLVVALLGAPTASADPTCYGQTPTITGAGTIDGTAGDDVIMGSAGDDVINGNGGHDYICAGDGNDQVYGGDDSSALAGQDGDDIVVGGLGNDYIDGGRGTDQCGSTGGNDRIYGCTNPTQFVVGQSAPDIVSRTAFDNRFRLADLTATGQNVMIDFSTLWCGPSVSMLSTTAGVQATLRKARVPFTYVLGELQNEFFLTSTRSVAERTSERWSLGQLPVLHAEGTTGSGLFTAWQEFSSENVPYDPDAGTNNFFPTLVFIDKAGIVTEVHIGSQTPQEILDRYKPGLTPPAPIGSATASMVGSSIEDLRSRVDLLTINSTTKATLEGQLTSALRALDVWMKPKTTSCDWMKLFDASFKKTPGVGAADRADIVAASNAIKAVLGCK